MSIDRTCNQCKKILPLDEFHADRTKTLGRSYVCKPCTARKRAEYHAENPHVARKGKQRRRAAARKHPVFNAELDELVFVEITDLRQRRREATGIEWHEDHVVPLRGKDVCGLHNAYNMAVAPAQFNLSKGNRATDHWVKGWAPKDSQPVHPPGFPTAGKRRVRR